MLGHPAFVPAHYGSYAQAQALFAEEGVAAVSGADADDFARFREVGDVSVFGVARPENVVFGRVNRLADGVHAGNEFAVFAENVEHLGRNARQT